MADADVINPSRPAADAQIAYGDWVERVINIAKTVMRLCPAAMVG